MIAALLLGSLAIVDAGFCGFRDAAGKDRRIEKRAYYRRAIARGMLLGLAMAVVFFIAIALIADVELWPDLWAVAARMVAVYGAYATLVLVALGVYELASGDLRALATVAVLGPFTLIRPLVIAAGAAWGAIGANHATTAIIACLAGSAMICFESALGMARRKT